LTLDRYIYDSQFLFLEDQVVLREAYHDSVLKNAGTIETDGLKGCVKKELWDSEKFGVNIGRLLWLQDQVNNKENYEKVILTLRQFNCCYIRLNANHTFCKQAHENALRLLSSKASQAINLQKFNPEFDSLTEYKKYSETINREDILEQVLELSKNSFQYNRFRSDDFFKKEMIDEIYASWIKNEVQAKDSELYYTMENGKISSFFLYKENISPLKKYKIGFVSLIATSPEFKGKRNASNLLNFVLNSAKKNGTAWVIANTELKNESALNFFKKNNFTVTSILNEYHLWN
jgi:ribosomal protein S18 acetylase RimI-like enzyme